MSNSLHTLFLSQSPYLRYASGASGIIAIGLGINAIIRPITAIQGFGFAPKTPSENRLLRDFGQIYAVRDLIMGVGLISAAYYNERNTAGWLMVAVAGVAAVDGMVNERWEKGGKWKHWVLAPLALGTGVTLLGVLDRV
jgi:hypothetical protein